MPDDTPMRQRERQPQASEMTVDKVFDRLDDISDLAIEEKVDKAELEQELERIEDRMATVSLVDRRIKQLIDGEEQNRAALVQEIEDVKDRITDIETRLSDRGPAQDVDEELSALWTRLERLSAKEEAYKHQVEEQLENLRAEVIEILQRQNEPDPVTRDEFESLKDDVADLSSFLLRLLDGDTDPVIRE